MKFRWHLLFLILGTGTAIIAAIWLNSPVWQFVDLRYFSFDSADITRHEWHTIVGNVERTEWWLETRTGRDPAVIRRMRLDLGVPQGNYQYFGSFVSGITFSQFIVCNDYLTTTVPGKINHRTCVLDRTTGKRIREFSIPNNPIMKVVSHGNLLAYLDKEQLKLFDLKTNQENSWKVSSLSELAFSPDGKLLACVDQRPNKLFLIDCSTGRFHSPLDDSVHAVSMCFLDNSTLLMSTDRQRNQIFSRWKWDGSTLKQISPGIKLTDHSIGIRAKTVGSELQFDVSGEQDWPARWKAILQWLADQKLPVERWFPKKYYLTKYVLDDQDRIIRTFQVRESESDRHAISGQLAVEIEADLDKPGATIRLWNLAPVWPNAVAAGLVMYLLLYVAGRCWVSGRLQSQLHS